MESTSAPCSTWSLD